MRSIFHLRFVFFSLVHFELHDYRCHFNRFGWDERAPAHAKKFIDNPSHFRRWTVCNVSFFSHWFRLCCMSFGFVISFNFIESITHLIEFLHKNKLLLCVCVRESLLWGLDWKEHRIRLISQLRLIKCRLIESLPTSSSVPFELR